MMMPARQRGATLIIALIMLLILTLYVVTSVNLGAVDLKIAGNVQAKTLVESAVQQGIEQVLSSETSLTTSTAQTLSINGISVAIDKPSCLYSSPVAGYYMTASTQTSLAPLDTQWEVAASGTDAVTGATTAIHQGVRLRLPVGSECP